MKISVIIPTIQGREDSLERTLDGYRETTAHLRGIDQLEVEFVVVHDEHNWPTACNAGQLRATGEILHFGADDLVPYGNWLPPCLPVLDAGILPAPYVYNLTHEGNPDNLQDGVPGNQTTFTRVPILTRTMAETIGPWPDINYYADNWVSDKARLHGWPTHVVAGYEFIHFWHQHGRLDQPERVEEYAQQYAEERRKLGLA